MRSVFCLARSELYSPVISDSTLIMHSDFENEPISSGYFVYKVDQFGKDRVLLGQVDDVELLSQLGDVELENSVSNLEIESNIALFFKKISGFFSNSFFTIQDVPHGRMLFCPCAKFIRRKKNKLYIAKFLRLFTEYDNVFSIIIF